jgi:hypothetical protein
MQLLRFTRAAALSAVALASASLFPARAGEPEAYVVEVSDVTAKVGATAMMVATLKIRDGYRILEPYRNRVSTFSSYDDGVEFEAKAVQAELRDGALVFAIPLHATKPGKHPINGLFRVGYVQDPGEMSMVSMKLIANVIGTE